MDRYYVEDTAYGLATWSSLGKTIGVPTPMMDAVIHLISALHRKNYLAQGERTLDKFGLENLDIKGLNYYLETGIMPG
jgi:opine dehydrogenase